MLAGHSMQVRRYASVRSDMDQACATSSAAASRGSMVITGSMARSVALVEMAGDDVARRHLALRRRRRVAKALDHIGAAGLRRDSRAVDSTARGFRR